MPNPAQSPELNISLESLVVATREQVSSNLDDGAVILNLANGTYYGLDPLGAEIWKLLQEPRTVRAVRDHILNEYDVEPERCERDLLALLRDMHAAGLVTISDLTAR